jgi:hypothetical protein
VSATAGRSNDSCSAGSVPASCYCHNANDVRAHIGRIEPRSHTSDAGPASTRRRLHCPRGELIVLVELPCALFCGRRGVAQAIYTGAVSEETPNVLTPNLVCHFGESLRKAAL